MITFIISFKSNYKKITFALVICVLLLVTLFLASRQEPAGFFSVRERTADKVTFLGEDYGKISRRKVEDMLAAQYGEWQINPLDAFYDPLTGAVLPEIWGYRFDVPRTVEKILKAAPGEEIKPCFEPLFPEVTVKDYPSAYIDRGNPVKNQVSFMINIAWGTEHIFPLLDVLDHHGARATFFVVGKWAAGHSFLLEAIAGREHELASHGHTDAIVFTKITVEEMNTGLEEVNRLIGEITGKRVKYFTPHKGEYNQLVLETVARQGMRTVLWSVDTIDWMEPGVEQMKERVLGKLHHGAIILMHPTAHTVELLREIIPVIQKEGFKLVTIEELLSPDYPPLLALKK